jgi:hypothetical protein
MAASEGFRRITTLGKRTAITGALLMLVGVFTSIWVSHLPNHQADDPAGIFLGPGAFLLIVGVLLLIAAWIGDGFVTKRDSDILPPG